MGFLWFGKRRVINEEQKQEREAYDKREKVSPLRAFFTIINRNQSSFYTKAYSEVGASMSIILYSYSQPPQEIAKMLGPDNLKKEIIITFVKEEDVPKLMKIAQERFSISKAAKGIAFACPIDSVSGIAVYKFLSDQNKEVREYEKNGKK